MTVNSRLITSDYYFYFLLMSGYIITFIYIACKSILLSLYCHAFCNWVVQDACPPCHYTTFGDKGKIFWGHGDAQNNVFQPGSKESWSTYTERLGHYFVANKVMEAEQKHAILLFVCGPMTFKLIKTLADLHEQVSYHDLCWAVWSGQGVLPVWAIVLADCSALRVQHS